MNLIELRQLLSGVSQLVGDETEVIACEDPERGLCFDITDVEIVDDRVLVRLV